MLLLRVHVLLLSLMVASEACEPNDPDGHRPSSGKVAQLAMGDIANQDYPKKED